MFHSIQTHNHTHTVRISIFGQSQAVSKQRHCSPATCCFNTLLSTVLERTGPEALGPPLTGLSRPIISTLSFIYCSSITPPTTTPTPAPVESAEQQLGLFRLASGWNPNPAHLHVHRLLFMMPIRSSSGTDVLPCCLGTVPPLISRLLYV